MPFTHRSFKSAIEPRNYPSLFLRAKLLSNRPFLRTWFRLPTSTHLHSFTVDKSEKNYEPKINSRTNEKQLYTPALSRPDRNILYSDATSSNAYTDRKTWAIHGIHNQTGRDGNQRHGNFDALSCISSRILQPQARRQRR